ADASPTATETAVIGGIETFRTTQWVPDAVHAPEAWALGYQGAGARVAVIDGGIHSEHIDIKPNLDVAHSASFVPNWAFNTDQASNPNGSCKFDDPPPATPEPGKKYNTIPTHDK